MNEMLKNKSYYIFAFAKFIKGVTILNIIIVLSVILIAKGTFLFQSFYYNIKSYNSSM